MYILHLEIVIKELEKENAQIIMTDVIWNDVLKNNYYVMHIYDKQEVHANK